MVKNYEWVASTTSDGIRLHHSICRELEKPFLQKNEDCQRPELWDGGTRGEEYAFNLSRAYQDYARFLGFTGQKEKQIRALMNAASACFATDSWDYYDSENFWGGYYYRAPGRIEFTFISLMEEILNLCKKFPDLSKYLELDPFLLKQYKASYYMNADKDAKKFLDSLPDYSFGGE